MPSALVFSSRAYQSSIEIDGTPFAFQSSSPIGLTSTICSVSRGYISA
jgi:hypothetical protein